MVPQWHSVYVNLSCFHNLLVFAKVHGDYAEEVGKPMERTNEEDEPAEAEEEPAEE